MDLLSFWGVSNEQSTQVLEHLMTYAKTDLKRELQSYRGSVAYHYDWGVNTP